MKTSNVATIILLSSFAPACLHAYPLDTVAAFTIPALATYYAASKTTIAQMRARAQAIVDDYENNRGIFTMQELRTAYQIVKSSNDELQSRMWWNNIIRSALAGTFVSLIYHMVTRPSQSATYVYCPHGGTSEVPCVEYAAPIHHHS